MIYMVFLIINVIFILILFILRKVRNSKQENMRLLFSDYYFYSTLLEDKKERFWQHSTNTLSVFIMGIGSIINILILVAKQLSTLQTVMFFVVSVFMISVIYCKYEINYRRKLSGKRKVYFFY